MMRLGSRLFPGKTTLEKPRLFLYRSPPVSLQIPLFSHCSHGNKEIFSCRGIQLAVDWFRDRGHTYIKVFVPSWRKEPPRSDAPIRGMLEWLHSQDALHTFPPQHSPQLQSAVCLRLFDGVCLPRWTLLLLLLLLSCFSRVWICATPQTAAHQAPPSLGFSRQEYWSGLPFPSPMHESENWKWSCSVMSDSSRPHGLQPTRLLHPWDFPGKSTGMGCHCLLHAEL